MTVELRKFTHKDRLNIGQQISKRVLDKYGDDVLAVFICGSTAKQLDRPYSDLEIIAVVHDGVTIPEKYYVYRGLVVEVAYPQESDFLKAARRFSKNWPLEADQYRNRIVLFEQGQWVRQLEEAVAENEKADGSEAVRLAGVELTEDLCVLRNALLTDDTIGIRSRGRALAGDAAGLVFLLNRRYVTTTSWFWKQAFECPWKPNDFEELVKKSASFTPASPEEIVTAAEQLYAEIMEMVRSRGISIETAELVV